MPDLLPGRSGDILRTLVSADLLSEPCGDMLHNVVAGHRSQRVPQRIVECPQRGIAVLVLLETFGLLCLAR